MRIGIFGGTFDPPHIGHLILAAEAYAQFDLETVLWVITPDPPHKQNQIITPLKHRLDMVNAAIAMDPNFNLSRIEIDRPGPHYVVDTMQLLRERYPKKELFYLMGRDSMRDLPNWYRPRQFVAYCNAIGVMEREGANLDMDSIEKSIPGIHEKIQFIHVPQMEISSREIRERVASRRPYRYFLPNPVVQIIQERRLYRSQE
jgi:nicotinate-nucleotide adenylyltransferase